MSAKLLKLIDIFLAENPMSDGRFSMRAAGNGRFLERLRESNRAGRVSRTWPETEMRIRAFMLTYRSSGRKRRIAKAPSHPEGRAA